MPTDRGLLCLGNSTKVGARRRSIPQAHRVKHCVGVFCIWLELIDRLSVSQRKTPGRLVTGPCNQLYDTKIGTKVQGPTSNEILLGVDDDPAWQAWSRFDQVVYRHSAWVLRRIVGSPTEGLSAGPTPRSPFREADISVDSSIPSSSASSSAIRRKVSAPKVSRAQRRMFSSGSPC